MSRCTTLVSAKLLAACLLAACTSEGRGPDRLVGPRGDASEFVVGAAAEALDPDGRFRLAPPERTRPDAINESRATAIAAAWVQTFGPLKLSTLEAQHGASINLATLRPCERVLYAESAFEPLPQDYDPLYHRQYGPWWLLAFCDGSRPVLSVAVSAYASHIDVIGGKLQLPKVRGMDVYLSAVGADWDGAVPDSPERAVRRVAERTATRISEVPLLITPDPTQARPQAATWRLRTERPVRASGRAASLSEVFVGASSGVAVGPTRQPLAEVAIPRDSQPAEVMFKRLLDPSDLAFAPEAVRHSEGRAVRRVNVPIRFQKVTLEEGAR